MEFRVISLPPFRAASSGADADFDFSPNGILGKFSGYFSEIIPSDRDSFLPRDFLFFDEERKGMVWMWALSEEMDDEGHELVDLDVRTNHYAMGHIITPAEIIKAQGWAQMETFIPIKLKGK